jgi:hypothetical protein
MWVYTPSATTLKPSAIWMIGSGAYGTGSGVETQAGDYVYFEITTFDKSIEVSAGIGFAFLPKNNVFVTDILLIA